MSPGKPDAGAAGIGQGDCLSFVSTRRDVTEIQRTLTGRQLDLRAGARGRAARIAQPPTKTIVRARFIHCERTDSWERPPRADLARRPTNFNSMYYPPGDQLNTHRGE